MSHYKESGFLKGFLESYFPNKRDNLKQIIIKVLFLVSFVGLIVSAGYIGNYFITAEKEDKVIETGRDIWYSTASADTDAVQTKPAEVKDPVEILTEQNSDFKGWLTISGVNVDNPVYQTDNNDYYLNHNQNREKSVYGALFFDCDNVITEEKTDKNLIIYGHEMKNGSMFGSLKKLKNLNFYKEHSTVELTLGDKKSVYRIYAVFVLNATKADDNGYIYNIFRQSFVSDYDFNNWIDEAKKRSIINTNVEVKQDDDILTLVTCSEDFENARLIVMAKKLGDNEDTSPQNNAAHTNPEPLYPQKWYDERGIKKEEN